MVQTKKNQNLFPMFANLSPDLKKPQFRSLHICTHLSIYLTLISATCKPWTCWTLSVSESTLSWPAPSHSLSLCFGMAAILMSWPSPASDGPAPVSRQSPVENIAHFTVWVGRCWIILISSLVDFSISRPSNCAQTSQNVHYYVSGYPNKKTVRCLIALKTADDQNHWNKASRWMLWGAKAVPSGPVTSCSCITAHVIE